MAGLSKRYFGTDGIRGRVGEGHLTPEFMLRLAWAAGKVLAKEGYNKVLIGKDTRVSGYLFESALEAGFSASGMHVYVLGPMPTPAIAYLTQDLRAQAGVVVSASHNAYEDNGIKFFGPDGKKLADEIEHAIEAMLDEPMQCVPSQALGKAKRLEDAPGRYVQFCKSTFPKELKLDGLTIVLDCAHGATYRIAPCVFEELGAKVLLMGAEPDGFNINAACGSVHPEMLQQEVLRASADLGIAFDGDGDRLMMVDHEGELVDGDAMLYILAMHAQAHCNLAGTDCAGVVGTVMSNLGLEQALGAQGIPFYRAKVGDRHVAAMMEAKGCYLGGEASGHIINGAHTMTGDGIITALQVLAVMRASSQRLKALLAGLYRFPHVLINVPTKQSVSQKACACLDDAVQAEADRLGDRGRILLRPSGTEACVRVMVEGSDVSEVEACAARLADAVRAAFAAVPLT